MKNIDSELIDWAVSNIKSNYKDDVSLLIGQFGGCKLPTDEQKLAFDYYVPATERGYQLAETFIIEDMGYDLYPMTFERLEEIADFEEPRMIWVLEKSEVIYAKNNEDRMRFEQIKEKLHNNFNNEEKTMKTALQFVDIAMEVYTSMLFEENLCKVRKAAGGVSSMLTYALAMINKRVVTDGYGNLINQVKAMEHKPDTFAEVYMQIMDAGTVETIRDSCRSLIKSVRTLLNAMKIKVKHQEETEDYINYEDLASWYQEARYTFRKITYYSEKDNAPECYSLGCYLQIEFDAIREEFALKEMDLMGVFDSKNLQQFLQQSQNLENYLVEVIQSHDVAINQYESLEDFLQRNM